LHKQIKNQYLSWLLADCNSHSVSSPT